MALGIFPHSVDVKGQLTDSTTPSSDNDLSNKKYVDDNSGGGGGFTLSTVSADLTIGAFQTAYDAASATGWTISPSGLEIPSGKTLLGIRYELQNTLGRDSFGSFMGFSSSVVIGIDDPSTSTIMPVMVTGGWGGNSFSQGGPYFQYSPGPSLGWYYQNTSYVSQYIVNVSTTTTDYRNEYCSACIKVGSDTQVKLWVYESPGSYTWEVDYSGTIPTTTVLGKIELQYA